jgi:hypothetical protein
LHYESKSPAKCRAFLLDFAFFDARHPGRSEAQSRDRFPISLTIPDRPSAVRDDEGEA